MAEYIEREALFQALTDKFKARLGSSHLPTWNDAFDTAKSIPSTNVRPVVQGKWAVSPEEWLSYCSICGQRKPIVAGNYKWNYCPNCGADMREAQP